MQEQLNNSLLVNTDGKGSAFSTWVSFAEIYNENVYDLLDPTGSVRQKRQNLALGVDNKGQVYIKGRTSVIKILERFVAYCLQGIITSKNFFSVPVCVRTFMWFHQTELFTCCALQVVPLWIYEPVIL